MWNIEYTIPTFLILLILLIYYAVRPKLKTRVNRTFSWLLAADVATMFFDYVSTIMDVYHDSYSIPALYVANTLFFVCFMLRSYLFYRMTVSVLELRFEKMKWSCGIAVGLLLLSVAIAVLSLWKQTMFSIDQEGYHSGPFYNVLYIQFLYCILLSIVLLFRFGRAMSKFDFVTVLIYNLLLLLGLVIRYLMPKVVIMNMFCLLAIFVVFLNFENPGHFIDKKTGLFSRTALETIMNELIATGGMRQMLGFVIKNYVENRELYGGRQMDAGIVSIAAYLKETFPKYTIYYLRGGQFVIGMQDGEDVEKVYEAIRDRFQNPWKAENANLFLQVGFVTENSHTRFQHVAQFIDCLQDAFRRVDNLRKSECLVLDESRRQEWMHRLAVKRAIENAISENRVEVYLQPIVDAGTYTLVGAEALARIMDTELGLIMPSDFIQIAEKNGSIITLGEQIFRKTCAFFAEYREQLGLQWINVNLSPIQCMDSDLPMQFSAIVNEYHIPPEGIHLEITEQQNVDSDSMNECIHEMRKMGFSFVLDDYGTGYSNMERIRKLPLINVKIDMSLVWEYFRTPDPMLPLCINLAQNIGASVTAEGVEERHMAEELHRQGCDYLQGYYFSPPVPMEDFVRKYRLDSGN